MNLVEVIVASSLFLSACGGAAQIGSSSAQAMAQSRSRSGAMESIEVQLLAVNPVLRVSDPQGDAPDGPAHDCSGAARWMQQQLAAALPPLPPGVHRQISLAEAGDQVVLVLQAPDGLRRERRYSPAAFGLCGGFGAAAPAEQPAQPSAVQPIQEPGDALL